MLGSFFRSTTLGFLIITCMLSSAIALPPAGVPDAAKSQTFSAGGLVEIEPVDGFGAVLSLADLGMGVQVAVRDEFDNPVIGFPASDIWLGDVVGGTEIALRASTRLNASVDTNPGGFTTIIGVLRGGGRNIIGGGLQVYAGGVPIGELLPILTASADMMRNDGGTAVPGADGIVNFVDLATVPGGFANIYFNGFYDEHGDLNLDGFESLLDVVDFSFLYLASAACP